MPPIRVKHIISFSSQDPKHTVEDLVRGRGSWMCNGNDKTGRLQADLQLEWATNISYIDIGNAGSVMVSIEVGRSCWAASQPYVTLLRATSLITAEEWRNGKNKNTVRMFRQDDMDKEVRAEKWDRVRIICLQPFRKTAQFGLSIFRLHTNLETGKNQLSNVVFEFDMDEAKSAANKEELVSKMNLPVHKKSMVSSKIGWLESRVLSKSDDINTTAAPNPVTSPVSRAAKLLSMATPATTKEALDSHKQQLEREALHYLISLNLSIDDIYSMKVIGVRQDFEKQRGKPLAYEEKVIFKDISLDYAKRRLEVLENKEHRKNKEKVQKYNKENSYNKDGSKKDCYSIFKEQQRRIINGNDTENNEKTNKETSALKNNVSSNSKLENNKRNNIKGRQYKNDGENNAKSVQNNNNNNDDNNSQSKFKFRRFGQNENRQNLGKNDNGQNERRQLGRNEDLSNICSPARNKTDRTNHTSENQSPQRKRGRSQGNINEDPSRMNKNLPPQINNDRMRGNINEDPSKMNKNQSPQINNGKSLGNINEDPFKMNKNPSPQINNDRTRGNINEDQSKMNKNPSKMSKNPSPQINRFKSLQKTPKQISEERRRLRDDDDLSEICSPSRNTRSETKNSRNKIALADSKITTPKPKARKSREFKKLEIQSTGKKKRKNEVLKDVPTNFEKWITPKAKKMRESAPFTLSKGGSFSDSMKDSKEDKDSRRDSMRERKDSSDSMRGDRDSSDSIRGDLVVISDEEIGIVKNSRNSRYGRVVEGGGEIVKDSSSNSNSIDSRGGFLDDTLPFNLKIDLDRKKTDKEGNKETDEDINRGDGEINMNEDGNKKTGNKKEEQKYYTHILSDTDSDSYDDTIPICELENAYQNKINSKKNNKDGNNTRNKRDGNKNTEILSEDGDNSDHTLFKPRKIDDRKNISARNIRNSNDSDGNSMRNGNSSSENLNSDSGYCLNIAPVDKYGVARRKAARRELFDAERKEERREERKEERREERREKRKEERREERREERKKDRREERRDLFEERMDIYDSNRELFDPRREIIDEGRETDEEDEGVQCAGPSTSSMVECPLCLGNFRASNIEAHAARCGTSSPTDHIEIQEDFQDETSECPICGKMIKKSILENHASECASKMFD